MNYKEKYESGLECIQEILSGAGDSIKTSILRKRLQPFFPELKENEDKRIRKGLIKAVSRIFEGHKLFDTDVTREEALAWLEKQGNKSVNIDVESMVSSYEQRLESQGGTKYTPLVNMCLTSFRHGVENVLEELNLKKLEKQGKQKPILDFKASDWYVSKVDGKIHNIYYSVDKVEPKFKVGNWFVNNNRKDVFLIKSININGYCTLEDIKGNIISPCLPPCESDSHLWTIEDAKDGDVLATENFIFIFKNIDDGNGVHYYCQYEISKHEDDNQFDIALPQSLMGRVGNSILHYSPATKEQRDLLFQKMKEAGYEWNSEKKELKKIEI